MPGTELPRDARGCADTAALAALIVEQIRRQVPSVDEPLVHEALALAAPTAGSLTPIYRHLHDHPDALRSGDPRIAPVAIGLLRHLADLGADVVLPVCSRCLRPSRYLPAPVPGGRVCRTCLKPGRPAVCASCHQQGLVKRCGRRDNVWLCAACWPPLERPCALCRRTRRILTRWPLGEVCGTCYKRVRTKPAACTACHTVAPLIGRTAGGNGLCPACADDDRTYACARCGTTGFFFRAGHCHRCQLTDRLTHLFSPDSDRREELRPFIDALASASSPGAVLAWLAPGKPAAALLTQLLSGPAPITHDALDDLPQTLALHRLRQTLTHTGVLPVRPDDLARLTPWLTRLLRDQPASRTLVLRAYAQWHVLRRSRQRARHHAFTRGSASWTRTRILAALALLAWLDTQHLALSELTQSDLDRWIVQSPSTASDAREFIRWSNARRLTRGLSIPKRRPIELTAPLADDTRWHHLHRCLDDADLPIPVRAAGALVLLYGIPLTRISTLRTSDLGIRSDGHTYLQLGRHHLRLVPALAELLHRQQTSATSPAALADSSSPADPWLFPGGFPGSPARYILGRALRHHGIPHLTRARSAALIALAAELPPAVLASLLDIHISTAIGWGQYAQSDWTTYLAARTST